MLPVADAGKSSVLGTPGKRRRSDRLLFCGELTPAYALLLSGALTHSSRNGERKMKLKNLALILLGTLFAFSTLTGCPPTSDDDDSAMES